MTDHRGPQRVQPVGGDGRAADRRHQPAQRPARPRCRSSATAGDRGRPGPAGQAGHAWSPPSGGLDVLAKPLANGDVSVVLFNETGSTATISTTAAAIGKTGSSAYTLTDLWSGATSAPPAARSAPRYPAHGTVMYRVAGGTSGGERRPRPANCTRWASGKCLDVPNSTTTAGYPGGDLGLQRWGQPDLDRTSVGPADGLLRRQPDVPGRLQQPDCPRHQGGDLDLQRRREPAVAAELQRHRSPACSPACAWTSPVGVDRPTAPWPSCGPATAAANQQWTLG